MNGLSVHQPPPSELDLVSSGRFSASILVFIRGSKVSPSKTLLRPLIRINFLLSISWDLLLLGSFPP